MSVWTTAFGITNIASGMALFLLGVAGVARGTRSRLGLPLFLIVWGAQIVLTNIGQYGGDSAQAMFLLGLVFSPLQSLMLLAYVHQEAGREHRPIRIGCWINGLIVGLAIMAGLALAVLDPPAILTVKQLDDGTYGQNLGWGYSLFNVPRYLGIGLALFYMALLSSPDRPSRWRLVCGLTAATGWTTGWTAASFLESPDGEWLLLFNTCLAAVFLTAAAAHLVRQSLQQRAGRLPAFAALAFCTVSVVAELPDWDPLWYFGSVGVWRLVAVATLLTPGILAIARRPTFSGVAAVPFVGAAACLLAAGTIGAAASLVAVSPELLRLAAGLGLAVLLLVALLTVPITLRLLVNRVASIEPWEGKTAPLPLDQVAP